ncbi:MAG TPA: sigma-70 family RNA polymerase sigma factor [Pyrinomonadaceae bacterium]|nr:sigma-70 family RNA polymerase sigma factor [Pyrinomonadaceae bacterium]
MAKERYINEEDFEALLAWLGADRDSGGGRYEGIRRSLTKIFLYRGFSDADEMADETINRVARNVKRIQSTYIGDPILYFYNVANKLMMECGRKKLLQVPLDEERTDLISEPDDSAESTEVEFECLDRCLQKLEPDERALILSYYQEDKQAKIDHRKVLAREMNVDLNALRVRVYRIRARLEKCIEDCLGKFQK